MIERLYPGVFLTELPLTAHPIEGVSTSSTDAAGASAHIPEVEAPAWTESNQSDPGVTLVQLFSWLAESLEYRTQLTFDRFVRHAVVGTGIASGLAVVPGETTSPGVTVTPGEALGPDGRPVNRRHPPDA